MKAQEQAVGYQYTLWSEGTLRKVRGWWRLLDLAQKLASSQGELLVSLSEREITGAVGFLDERLRLTTLRL